MEIGKYYYKKLYKNPNIKILPPSNEHSKNIYWVVGILIKNKKIKSSLLAKKLLKYGLSLFPKEKFLV